LVKLKLRNLISYILSNFIIQKIINMDFKKGKWCVGDAFDLDKASDLIDDKMAKNIMGDLKKQLGPEGFPRPPHGGAPANSGLYSDLNVPPSNQYVPIKQAPSRQQPQRNPPQKADSKSRLDKPPSKGFWEGGQPPPASKLNRAANQGSKPDLMGHNNRQSPLKPNPIGGGIPTPKGSSNKLRSGSQNKDSDLLSSMTKRLAQVE